VPGRVARRLGPLGWRTCAGGEKGHWGEGEEESAPEHALAAAAVAGERVEEGDGALHQAAAQEEAQQREEQRAERKGDQQARGDHRLVRHGGTAAGAPRVAFERRPGPWGRRRDRDI
jgi:hypothetical protein